LMGYEGGDILEAIPVSDESAFEAYTKMRYTNRWPYLTSI